LHRVIVAALAYLARHGTPGRPEDLAGPPYRRRASRIAIFALKFKREGQTTTVEARAHVDERYAGALAAASGGLGIPSTTSWACRLELESGALVRLLADWETAALPVHAYFPLGRATRMAARAFVDFIADDLQRDRPIASR
jgi:DNA-binding transcriptional LysR family regulator